ncbi:DUF4377 domain-containing protein [Aquimarina sp. 2201CG5-10]|uniref:DUF4377 domain-containing protein n=1 Tax=Aquimarina callyspongiae TaxID=3098150 RepID=UPI002AB5708B|nr:DUF4377 domain-containing protein [Aquimarina sp. 2201CG5-10]MDY8135286.1 DUF4377 domain-containing protein [Aquimarina sp. 2201CG5-10]
MKKIVALIFLIALTLSCKEKKRIYVASYTQECEGASPQTCLLIKENMDQEWQLFYDTIEGFTYETGYEYQLEVTITPVKNPAADASSLQYTLIKVLSKEKDQSSSQKKLKNISYQALSRDSFLYIEVDENNIKKTSDRDLKNFQSIKCSEKDWNTILSLIKQVNIKEIHQLKAPSQKRLFDGAPHGLLKITLDNKTYPSNGFDHGNPPQIITPLINHILTLSESIE